MSASASEQPLIPQPSASIGLLRDAVAQIAPAALPAFARELIQATDQARRGPDLLPLRRFTAQWAVYVHIQRHPGTAARFRALEDLAVAADNVEETRSAVAELGRILDAAHAAVAREAP
ncbi:MULTISPECIES: hypothetical protein [Streptomyces]|uniref:hypothetical protein n=1 Tax=Streptomyces TaxID=1883 RepID=UPI0004CCC509|nr:MULTISPECIES: hypothetical protein [Streptomyces]KOT51577.1 hypothetical protein ADK43_31795 [Streptomyces rimosus subsp. rimosus]